MFLSDGANANDKAVILKLQISRYSQGYCALLSTPYSAYSKLPGAKCAALEENTNKERLMLHTHICLINQSGVCPPLRLIKLSENDQRWHLEDDL